MPDDPGAHLPLRPVEFEILVSLGTGPKHGYAILKDAEARRGTAPGVTTLYRALQRMRDDGLVEAAADPDAGEEAGQGGPSREVVRLTPLGRRVGRAEARRLEALLGRAREGVLDPGR